MLIFCYIFLSGEFLRRMFYLWTTYHVNSVYFSGVQESVCVVDRNQILSDVTSSDHIVHSISMVNRMQLQY